MSGEFVVTTSTENKLVLEKKAPGGGKSTKELRAAKRSLDKEIKARKEEEKERSAAPNASSGRNSPRPGKFK